jgi:DNA-binding transcriptional ArsR family regulator
VKHTALAEHLPTPADYETDDVLVVSEPEPLRALADELRGKIVILLRERAYSVSELAAALSLPKGTVAHHVKVLERAGLIRVVRERKVRALTERYYGRVARLFLVKGEEYPDEVSKFVASGLRLAAEELRQALPGEAATSAFVHSRLTPEDARRFDRRLKRLVEEFQARGTATGARYGLAFALYPTEAPRD